MVERLARLCVGIGFIWVSLIVLWAIAAGVEQPYAWFKWAHEGLGYAWMYPTYLVLALFIVPAGMLTFVRDIMGDPVAMWVKFAIPGAFLAIYAFFLLAALPEAGRPLFAAISSVVNPGGSEPVPGAAGSSTTWLIRLGLTVAVWAGVPGVIGAIVGMMTGSKAGVRRR
jgi:hypothetical protein